MSYKNNIDRRHLLHGQTGLDVAPDATKDLVSQHRIDEQ
jgi:hypothetical protein